MEFFFLAQDVSIELYLLICIFFTIVYLWGKDFYIYLKKIYEIVASVIKRPPHPHIDSGSIHIPNIPIEKPATIEEEVGEENETIEFPHSDKIDTSQVEKLTNLISSIRTLIARGMNHEAQALIVEGLSIEKNNRELNLLLGSIYEHEGQFEKAEYVYKDLAEIDPEDVEVLEKLANVLIIEKKNVIANEIYKKIHTFTGNTETTLYMLTHISNTLQDQESILKYSKQYILQWPKNPEIITLLAQSQIALGMRKDAIETYKHLKNLTPYSGEISEILQKLLIEEELANNFGGKE
ncbi:hypothetical protein K2X92_01810 [Candidatus Gracilibacteria bacterium]|nr:hypothetical protein [Candidatus Gracilibacteria bacterium]